jgi:GTPase SAR1 family protein
LASIFSLGTSHFKVLSFYLFQGTLFDIVDKTYRLQLWDTAGQEKYKSLVPAYLRDANCAVFVFDFSRKESFSDLPNWIQLYRDHAS